MNLKVTSSLKQVDDPDSIRDFIVLPMIESGAPILLFPELGIESVSQDVIAIVPMVNKLVRTIDEVTRRIFELIEGCLIVYFIFMCPLFPQKADLLHET